MAAQIGKSLQTVTIAAGQSLSPQADIAPGTLVGLYLPANWTAASLTFQVSPDGGATWFEHYAYSGSETVYGGAPSNGSFVAIDPVLWRGVVSLKIRSGTAASPVSQTNDAAIRLILAL